MAQEASNQNGPSTNQHHCLQTNGDAILLSTGCTLVASVEALTWSGVWSGSLGHFNIGLSTRWHWQPDSFSLFHSRSLFFFFCICDLYTVTEHTMTDCSQFTSWFLVLLTILSPSWHLILRFFFRPFQGHIETSRWDVRGWCLILEAMIRGAGAGDGLGGFGFS